MGPLTFNRSPDYSSRKMVSSAHTMLLLLTLLLCLATCAKLGSSVKSTITAEVIGDLMIGGLFPIHEKGSQNAGSLDDERCGLINEDRGIQRVEAMLFAIDKINNDSKILPGITLGASLRDTCSIDTFALEQSLEFVRSSLTSPNSLDCLNESAVIAPTSAESVAGVIGGSYSTVSMQVANLLRLFEIPQISYASTSARLSDKSRFEFFARTVPPDTLQAKAIADILAHFNWTYVSTVWSSGEYGESGMDQFEKERLHRNICIAASEKIPYAPDAMTYDDIIGRLLKKNAAKVVVLFTRDVDARDLLEAALRVNASEKFIWVASDGWGVQDMPVNGREIVAEGAITIELQTKKIKGFDQYFRDINPRTNTRNPWFKDFWEQKFKCLLEPKESVNVSTPCAENVLDEANHAQEKKTQFVVDAVFAMAHALHSMQTDLCPNTEELCDNMLPIDGRRLFKEYILNTTFLDLANTEVRFDAQGDGLGRYDIMNYRPIEGTDDYRYVQVGEWANTLSMDPSALHFHPGLEDYNPQNVPYSQCSKPCGKGEVKLIQDDKICCWMCIKCQPWEFLENEYTCKPCDIGYWPTEDLTHCYKLAKQHMQWVSVYTIVPICFSLIGIIVTCGVIVIFFQYQDTPLVKASSRELSFLLLGGILMCYSMTIPIVTKPSVIVCSIQRLGLGLSFCICYAAMLTKTSRIARIFDSASRSAQRPKYISPCSQLVICLGLISVQIFGELVWLAVDPPSTVTRFSDDKSEAILKCGITEISLVLSLVYDMFLIAMCTVYAFKTRKIPENFNEAKFISFTMYTTCIVWFAFVPVYFVTKDDFRLQTTTLCVSVSICASVALACLFAPKVYIIVFQPHKNVRRLSSHSSRRSQYDGARFRDEVNNHTLYNSG
ncbi:metabotropic glutamate receptor 3-like isoform X3 [Lytechinus variegatus]|uniref:metabotropic glutamate receptor 3-like isoform X3 n=1 Tax=Lytechinus variegatus TaxID=7654 RepID=UPI001BB22A27|nr:metabotropic glutamate receptor 3-like isoform X3 [Lytechinus variegatus]XP_041459356.1 metabotropic glutamate receptor 3-like isoform X3 [Lytechinus variegatus]